MSFISERAVKATRKRHLCNACDKWVEVGEAAVNWAGLHEGDFSSVHYHSECRQAEIALNRLHGLYNDEWTRLCDLAEPEDRPWLKSEHPLPYRRMMMTREQWAAQGIETAKPPKREAGSARKGESPVGNADAPERPVDDH